MNEMIFLVEEDPEGGYTARALGYPIFTEADTEEELKTSVFAALRCNFDNEADIPKIVRLHFVREQIIVNAKDSEGHFWQGVVQTAGSPWI
jgi:hypothetical protein